MSGAALGSIIQPIPGCSAQDGQTFWTTSGHHEVRGQRAQLRETIADFWVLIGSKHAQ